MTVQEAMGLRIRKLREEKGISQTTLAELVGYKDKTAIAKVEAGKVDLPQSKITAFAKALDTSTAYLFDGNISSQPLSVPSNTDIFPSDIRAAARGMMELSEADKSLAINMIKSLAQKGREAKENCAVLPISSVSSPLWGTILLLWTGIRSICISI